MNDLPRDMGWRSIDFSIHSLRTAISRGGIIRFDLSHIKDVDNVLANTGPFADKVTGQELRYIREHWEELASSVRFYENDQEVAQPW